jgi:hypothetical protein
LLYATSLFALAHKKQFLAILILLASALFRESGIYFALALTISLLLTKEISRKKALAFGAVTLAVMALLPLTYFGQCDGSQAKVAILTALVKLGSFSGALKIIAGLSHASTIFVNQGKV